MGNRLSLIGNMIVFGSQLRGLIEERISVEKRRANQIVSSWSVEFGDLPTGRWMEQNLRGEFGCHVTSAYHRCAEYVDEKAAHLADNGSRGGRGHKKLE